MKFWSRDTRWSRVQIPAGPSFIILLSARLKEVGLCFPLKKFLVSTVKPPLEDCRIAIKAVVPRSKEQAGPAGFEPATTRLRAERST